MAFRLLTLLLVAGSLVPNLAAAPAPETPKTVILGFDGMDYALTKQFMDQGMLPNMKKLAEQGSFGPLEPANPPESPVSWAVFDTGQNPGKNGVESFMIRTIRRGPDGKPLPGENPGLSSPLLGIPTTIEQEPATSLDAFAHDQPLAFAGAAAAAGLLAGFVLLRLVLRRGAALSLVVGLALAGVGWWQGSLYAADVPATGKIPWEINWMQGTRWWSWLDKIGVRFTGIQVAQTYPPDSEGPNTRILSGLGVRDVSGSPGKWFVFTDYPWVFEKGTASGGDLKRLFFDRDDGTAGTFDLPGPVNWVVDQGFKDRIAALESSVGDAAITADEKALLEKELADVKVDYNKWSKKSRVSKVEATITAPATLGEDGVAHRTGRVTIEVGGERVELGVGDWSDFVRIFFPFEVPGETDEPARQGEWGIVRFHLLACDDEQVRVFVPPINIDPFDPPHIPISSPPDFCADLAHCVGEAYETLGWACMTNPLKDLADSGFEIQSFMDDIGGTMARREEILACALDDPSQWDVYFQLFSTTDRVGHMLMREFDPQHPAHDAEYAAKEVTCWGKTFPLSRAIPEVYMQADRIVGGVMDKIASGALGPDCLLMLVADHGFTSFRREVNLNNLLHDFGYLVLEDESGKLAGKSLGHIDWARTRAYSIGLGKIYVNKLGREGQGIVTDAEYDGLLAAIEADLKTVTDGEGGPHVISEVWRRDELYSGPWVVENDGGNVRTFLNGREQPVGPFDGMGDLQVGFAPTYRVSWGTGFGGLEAEAISDNTGHWSGDHVSLDVQFVPGIFFSNRKMPADVNARLIDIGPTVVSRYGVDLATTDMDGTSIPLEGLAK